MFKNLGLRQKIASLTLLLCVFFALVGFGTYFLFNSVVDEAAFKDEFDQMHVAILELERLEQEFVRFLTKDSEFYESEGALFIEPFGLELKKLLNQIRVLQEDGRSDSDALPALTQSLGSNLEAYGQAIETLTTAYLERGFKDYGTIGQMRQVAHTLLQEPDVNIKAAVLQLRRHEKDFLLRSDPKYRDKFVQDHPKLVTALKAAARYDQANQAAAKDYLDRFVAVTQQQGIIGFFGNRGLHGKINQIGANIEADLAAITNVVHEHELAQQNQLNFLFILLFSVGILLGLGIAYLIIRIVTGPLKKLKSMADALNEGNLDVQVQIDSKDEIGAFGESLNQALAKAKEEDELKSKNAEWSQVWQRQKNMRDLCDGAISELCKFLSAGHGVFYVRDVVEQGQQENYTLWGTYGYKKRKGLSDHYAEGEGLVGQCIREKAPIMLSDVPQDYVYINSGLGEEKPNHIFLLPILFEDDVFAVIELASFQQFSDVQLQFLEDATSNLGIIINNALNRERTENLLKQTQEQAEELQTQQEELRAANEELDEKTKVLQTSEEELKAQTEELQATNEELEEKSESLERQKKDIESVNQAIEVQKDDLAIKAEALAQASKYKSEFLANMSHELRTPLNSLLILSKSLSDNDEGNLSEEQIEDARIIYNGGQQLLSLINDILDLSKVEAGKLTLNISPLSPKDITDTLQKQFDPVAKDKGLGLNVEIESSAPNEFHSDAQRIEQVIRNLLSNSFKFTDSGSVTLTVSGKDNWIHFSVSDTGVGIEQEKQDLIFEAFQQADGSTSRKYGGTGLGLAISKEFAKLLGGKMTLKSEHGKGATFALEIPAEAPQKSKSEQNPPKEASSANSAKTESKPTEETVEEDGNRIYPKYIDDDRDALDSKAKPVLVIEDDKAFAQIVMRNIKKAGHQVVVTPRGKEGIDLAQSLKPAGIILDLTLPDMKGEQVLDVLKSNLQTRHIPIHIISGREIDLELLKEGAIGFFKKPVSNEQLKEVLEKLERYGETENATILVIEDDEDTVHAIKRLIERQGIRIEVAESGKKGVEKILNHDFAAIILDLSLPDISGYDVLNLIAKEKPESDIPPIIVYSGRELEEEEYAKLQSQVKSVIVKGASSPERLLDEVSLFLHTVESDLTPEQRQVLKTVHDSSETLKGRKLLVVDDDARNVYAIARQLKNLGVLVEVASNGQEGIDKLKANDGIELVIMDIMMPVMDGHEAMREIRKIEKYKTLPILALTAKAMPEDKKACIDAGASDYMSKPIDVEKLIAMLRVWLSK